MKITILKSVFLTLACLVGLSCSGSHKVNPNSNATLTADYYGVREHTSGGGYDDPIEAERLLLGESRPITIIFAAPWSRHCKVLSEEIARMRMHHKVWFLDTSHSITSMLMVFTDAGEDIPTLVHLDNRFNKIVLKDIISIIEFVEKQKNEPTGAEIYE